MVLERTYTIPLRREILKVSRYKRTNKAVVGVRVFLERHMKSLDVRLGKYLNLALWKHGVRNPPSRVRVFARKYDDGMVRAELFGKEIEEPKKKEASKKKEESLKKEELKKKEKPEAEKTSAKSEHKQA